jgi:transposase-like protein
MAKYELRLKARKMRLEGKSVREIAQILGVARGTSSLWVRDIILSVEQLERLRRREIVGSERGRIIGALVQKRRRLEKIEKMKKEGIKRIGEIKENDLFILGLALYWAEGCKKTRSVQFCNSDPRMIQIMIYCFQT